MSAAGDRDKWFAVVMQELAARADYEDAIGVANRVIDAMWKVPVPSRWQRFCAWWRG